MPTAAERKNSEKEKRKINAHRRSHPETSDEAPGSAHADDSH